MTNSIRILQAVTDSGTHGLGFASIVSMTGIPKASTHRLLKELESLSALSFDTVSRRYYGGVMLARLGAGVLASYDIRRVVRPSLAALHEETGFVATLGVLNDDTGIYLDKIEGSGFGIRLHSEIGKAFPLHCTGLGKVLLANADTALHKRICSRKLVSFNENTITNGTELRREIDTVFKQGFAIDREEITRGLMCVAAPVYGADGTLAGAISCTFPSYVQAESGIAATRAAVIEHAAAASGHSPTRLPD